MMSNYPHGMPYDAANWNAWGKDAWSGQEQAGYGYGANWGTGGGYDGQGSSSVTEENASVGGQLKPTGQKLELAMALDTNGAAPREPGDSTGEIAESHGWAQDHGNEGDPLWDDPGGVATAGW